MKKYLLVSSAAVVIGALRVKSNSNSMLPQQTRVHSTTSESASLQSVKHMFNKV